jgi:xanthine/uracil permease
MVGISGYQIARSGDPDRRDWILIAVSVLSGLALSASGDSLAFLPQGVVNIIQFPVSSGAFVAMALEVVIPKPGSGQQSS